MVDAVKKEEVVEVPEERISEQDKHILEKAILQRQLAMANAEKAELTHNHIVLQLFMKHGMNVETDAIDERGVIKRNAVKK